jgi:hypothetical protein
MPKPTEESRESDIAKLSLELKKLNDEHKREGAERLSKSSNAADREMAENWKKNLANDTSTMIQTREGSGRRIGPDGRPVGPELKKLGHGEYQTEKKAKGGMTASRRADGIASRGKTRGKYL